MSSVHYKRTSKYRGNRYFNKSDIFLYIFSYILITSTLFKQLFYKLCSYELLDGEQNNILHKQKDYYLGLIVC